MPLTDLIQEELLATLDGAGDPQAVLDRHAGSKGPLYAALARATAEAPARFGGSGKSSATPRAGCVPPKPRARMPTSAPPRPSASPPPWRSASPPPKPHLPTGRA